MTGATTAIRPIDRARYRLVMPIPPAMPPATLQPQVGRAEPGLAEHQRQAEGERHPDDLRDEDDAEDGRPPARQAATEVAGAPCDRGGEPEDHGPRRAGQDVDQAGVSTGSPSSTAVGPGSSTTESAAAS